MLQRCLCSLLLVAAVAVVGCSNSTATKPNTTSTNPGPAPNKGGERLAPVEKVQDLPPRP